MRIGINVPNELLQRVKQIRPELNVSQVCREALEYRAKLAERAAAQAARDGADYHVDRLDHSLPKPIVEPDWVAYALEDARDWVRNIRPEGWQRFVHLYSSDLEEGRIGPDTVLLLSQSNGVYAEGVKGLYDRLNENSEWFIEQSEVEFASGIKSMVDFHQRAVEDYSRVWLIYVKEIVRLLAKRRREQLDRLMAERAERRKSLPKPELPVQVEDVQQAIQNLSKVEFSKLQHWLSELDWEEWDQEIEADAVGGKLDFLVTEAKEAEAKQRGKLEAL